MQKILYNFNLNYSDFRIVDLDAAFQQSPITIHDFKRITSEQIEKNKNYLSKNWLSECAEIIKDNKDCIEALINKHEDVRILKHI